jgi:phytoene/squalene synthetase
MKSLFDKVSVGCSRLATKAYSTSFSLGIFFLARPLREPVYAIYGFVRFADEIVDSFHGYQKKELLDSFRKDTEIAIREKISLNPILNSFQFVVHKYKIRQQWIDIFLDSMAMDLQHQEYDYEKYQKYIFGSAEVVGLMCLHVFTDGDESLFERLRPFAMKLGAAFQKVNFLRDIRSDSLHLGRTYFPEVDLNSFSKTEKLKIEKEIEADFSEALKGIKMLPQSSQNGVYMAYYYYLALFRRIKKLPAEKILNERIRIPNFQKMLLMLSSNLRHKLNLI